MWRRGYHSRGLSTPINPLPNSPKQTSPHTFTCEWWQCAICLPCAIQMATREKPGIGSLNLTIDMFELQAHCSCCWHKGFGETPLWAQPVNIEQYLCFRCPRKCLTNKITPSMCTEMDNSQRQLPQSKKAAIWVIQPHNYHSQRMTTWFTVHHASLEKCWKFSRAWPPTVTSSWK